MTFKESETEKLLDLEPCKLFMREWRQRFQNPHDWTTANIKDDTASLLDWLRYVEKAAQTDVNLTTIIRVFDRFEADGNERPPRLAEFRRRHAMMCGRHGGNAGGPVDRCEACDGTGVVVVPTIKRLGRVYLVKHPIRLLEGERLSDNSSPCMCSKGQRMNQHGTWQLSPERMKRNFEARVSTSQWHALGEACLALSGRPAEERVAPDSDTAAWFQGMLERHANDPSPNRRGCAMAAGDVAGVDRDGIEDREAIDAASLVGVQS